MQKELFRNFDSPLAEHRLVFQQEVVRPPDAATGPEPEPEETPNTRAADRLVAESREEGERAYFKALEFAQGKEVLTHLAVFYGNIKSPEAERAFLKKAGERIQREADAAYDRDGNFSSVIKAYGLKGVGPEGPRIEVVKAALREVNPGDPRFAADLNAQLTEATMKAMERLRAKKAAEEQERMAQRPEDLLRLVQSYRQAINPDQMLRDYADFAAAQILGDRAAFVQKYGLNLYGVRAGDSIKAILSAFLEAVSEGEIGDQMVAIREAALKKQPLRPTAVAQNE